MAEQSTMAASTAASAAQQCLANTLRESCHLSSYHLFIPKPLQPIIIQELSPTQTYYIIPTPLFLYGITLLVISLLLSHQLSKTPIEQIGQIGHRGRKYFSWNESITGGCGNKVIDWWIFGGSVWLRAYYCLYDLMFGGGQQFGVGDGGEEVDTHAGGENSFACFGVTHDNNAVDSSGNIAAKTNDDNKSDKKDDHNTTQSHCNSTPSVGILGYDSSLGAHGPLFLAPLRASIMLLVWCSISSFLIRTHTELVRRMVNNMNGPIDRLLVAYDLDLCIMRGIQSIMNFGAEHTESTIVYAASLIALVEISLFVIGKLGLFTTLGIYVPQGVSHPGGSRPRSIRMRLPKWTEGKQHYLPKELMNFRCAVGHDAHHDTEAKFSTSSKKNDNPKLTGEPFGRQIWSTMKPTQLQPTKNRVGQVETEDDLEATLEKEFLPKLYAAKHARKDDNNNNILSPISNMVGGIVHNVGSTVDNILLKEGKQNVIGEFVHNIMSPDKKKGDQKQQDDGSATAKFIQQLAAGGRTPLAFDPSKNPNTSDQLFRAQMITRYLEMNNGKLPEDISYMQQEQTDDNGSKSKQVSPPKTVMEAAKRGIAFYSMLQTSDGHFAGDYGGPHFLLPGLVVAWYVMGCPQMMISPPQQALMLYYLKVHQQEDGGWGTHIESPSTMFGSVMSYLAARLLGADKDLDWIKKGRSFIQNEGGAIMTSSWAKFWLCLVGCMDWKGFNSVPPEMWLLPNWFPFHPGRLWCHCRMVYLPMGYLYGSRFIYSNAETDPLIAELREELYCQPYESIPWDSTRHLVADIDNYSPVPLFMKFANNCLSFYENWSIFNPFRNFVRKAGLRFCSKYMHAEDLQTNYIDIGPVNKALNMVSAFHAANNDINNEAVQSHMMRVPDYLWVAEDGMKMQGYNGSQCWDTSFAIQAVWECGLLDEFPILSSKIWAYLERTQILSTETSQSSPAYQYESCESRDKFYRHVSKGGWPFSTSAHGWPISDCTGEGLKGVLALMDSPAVMDAVKRGVLKGIEPTRLHDAVNVILTLQNEDGGWATYENNRGFGWYEQLNPSEVFGDIMIDYSYVECSMASMTALAHFHEKFPHHRTTEIIFAIHRGREFMKSIQRDDGSWYGSWACCFCYGCWFGIEGLIRAGEPHNSPAIQKCCEFLLSHQRPNGGWGEDFTSCYDKDYAENGMESYGDEDGSGVVNTAWALMALSDAKCSDVDAIRRGVRYLMKQQLDCGDWPQEGISGVFNRACGITYTAYRNVFPIWALGRCASTYGSVLDDEVREEEYASVSTKELSSER